MVFSLPLEESYLQIESCQVINLHFDTPSFILQYQFIFEQQPYILLLVNRLHNISCFRYHKGTDFQANHNYIYLRSHPGQVVLDTTKVQIFKQITTITWFLTIRVMLFQIPQRYRFSSKSQQLIDLIYSYGCCFRYHKGTDFQANHNIRYKQISILSVVLDTTKVQIFKQITT